MYDEPMQVGADLPRFNLRQIDLPDVEYWEVGGQYYIIMKVEMTGKRVRKDLQNPYEGGDSIFYQRVQGIRHEKKIRRNTWASWIGSVIGIVVLIIVTYLFLNAVTKGYYNRTLKITLIVIGVVVIAALLLVVA